MKLNVTKIKKKKILKPICTQARIRGGKKNSFEKNKEKK